jgi:2-dehydro-3-deoxyphosphogluconate aldolase/(4S)-4-hydroxy-2-oxoglutarate aldolase
MRPEAVVDIIRRQRVVGIVRAGDAPSAYAMVSRLLGAGLAAVEVSLVTPGALDLVEKVVAERGRETAVGVGTVLSAEQVHAAVDCGATFVVAPTYQHDIVTACRRRDIAAIPGILTPTEAVAALDAGADLVKLFPATTWTPRAVRDLLTALPQLPLIPTGGVGIDDAPDWISAGAVAVGIGGALTRGDRAETMQRVRELLDRLRDAQ